MRVIIMEKNKKDYLTRTVGMQFLICTLIFIGLFILSKTDAPFVDSLFDYLSSELEKTVTARQVEDVFNNIGGYIDSVEKTDKISAEPVGKITNTDRDYKDIESLSVQIFSGGKDIAADGKTLPENVSLKKYKLDSKIFMPVNGSVSSKFGFRIHPITGEYGFHSGTDIAADAGTPIHSAFDGTVVFCGYDEWNGNFIKISHGDNMMTVYCHCSECFVNAGDVIRGGEVIARVGSTGSSTGPHLHFELRIDGISYDPEYALKTAVNAL